MKRVRTRFAPSPTGPLHIGGMRTALYSYLFAKKNGGDFILRIEDTDTARTVVGSEDLINESLAWCNITPNEGVKEGGDYGPYKQSERKAIYQEYAHQLILNGKAYYAFDTESEITSWREKSAGLNNGIADSYNFRTRVHMRNSLSLTSEEVNLLLDSKQPYVIRLKVDETDHVSFQDIIRDQVSFKSDQLDDRVLLKSDGMPTYHLANVVDDYLMKISHVIRGEEWLASTPHHVLLYKAFGWEDDMPKFAHLPLFLKPDGKGKLSKRDGDRLGFPVFCTRWENPETKEITQGFREKGFESEAFVNFIAMLGWNDGSEKEVFHIEELIQSFSLEKVHKAGAKFNYEKAIWYNQQFIHQYPIDILINRVKPELLEINPDLTNEFIASYCQLFQPRISFLFELVGIGEYMYQSIKEYDLDTLKKKWNEHSASFITEYIRFLSERDLVNGAQLEEQTKDFITTKGLSLGGILPILRIGLTGITKGPSVFDTILLLGKEESIARLKKLENLV